MVYLLGYPTCNQIFGSSIPGGALCSSSRHLVSCFESPLNNINVFRAFKVQSCIVTGCESL